MKWPALSLLDGHTLVVSPSQLALLQRCQRHWGYTYIHRRVLAARAVASTAGKAFHAALELRHRAATVTPTLEADMHAKLAEGFAGLEIPEDDYRNAGRYQRLLDAYNAHWRVEDFKTLGTEIPLMVPLGVIHLSPDAPYGEEVRVNGLLVYKRVNVLLKGIVDRLIQFPDGLTCVADTKTSKDWRSSHQKMWERAGAPRAYCWGLQELARLDPTLGLPTKVHGFCLDSVVVRREASTLKRPRKEGIEDQTFQRIIFPYDQTHLVEWRSNALAWIKSMLLQLGEGDLSYNESQCASFYGQTCPFLDVCSEPDDGKRELVLSFDQYAPYEPSPFERVDDAVKSIEEGA